MSQELAAAPPGEEAARTIKPIMAKADRTAHGAILQNRALPPLRGEYHYEVGPRRSFYSVPTHIRLPLQDQTTRDNTTWHCFHTGPYLSLCSYLSLVSLLSPRCMSLRRPVLAT